MHSEVTDCCRLIRMAPSAGDGMSGGQRSKTMRAQHRPMCIEFDDYFGSIRAWQFLLPLGLSC